MRSLITLKPFSATLRNKPKDNYPKGLFYRNTELTCLKKTLHISLSIQLDRNVLKGRLPQLSKKAINLLSLSLKSYICIWIFILCGAIFLRKATRSILLPLRKDEWWVPIGDNSILATKLTGILMEGPRSGRLWPAASRCRQHSIGQTTHECSSPLQLTRSFRCVALCIEIDDKIKVFLNTYKLPVTS